MRVLVFHIGADRYGLPLRQVRRVLPLLELKGIPLAPDCVAGLLNLHGDPMPVIDLSRISGGAPARQHFDTRIVLVDYTAPGGKVYALGLMAERVQGVQDVSTQDLAPSGVQGAPFLGRVAGDAKGLVQLVEVNDLLPAELRARLFPAQAEAI
ncbi:MULTISPECIES: chemotaxis protein CheW [unclassified Duganella]|uniref:chemotaxis protein CheW n=1 Tax=unclassified Duganella TaxID=2636909 RepID=UPI0006F7478D|nr:MULTISPECIES: chemotaxis protein CheW [unclassified Duganella]KQV46735.1 chemotaxis protein [Duganella sp. Root336D2]KRC00966.1 chemotaxis protein [Duganella sp. Root198D2]